MRVFPTRARAAGRIPRDGVLTQYYLREHIERLLAKTGFAVHACHKLEFGWEHEFGSVRPAEDVGPAAPPWDWLLVARRTE